MEANEDDDGSGDGFYATRQKIFSLLGFKAVELSRELRSAYRLSPPLLNTGTEKNALRKNSGTMTDSA